MKTSVISARGLRIGIAVHIGPNGLGFHFNVARRLLAG